MLTHKMLFSRLHVNSSEKLPPAGTLRHILIYIYTMYYNFVFVLQRENREATLFESILRYMVKSQTNES
jgi:hypothetical protein